MSVNCHEVTDIFLEDTRRYLEMTAPKIKDEMKKRYKIIISPPQSELLGGWSLIKSKLKIMSSLIMSMRLRGQTKIPQWKLTPSEERNEAFSQIYIFFEALKRSWKQDCKPIISLDGIFLKHYVQEIILAAIGRDPNTQIYLIAWNIVSAKNNEN
ncbi:hypothetical protein HID58_025305 [Brassica napus]|uniref:Uncharacterized protein n=1 Tax=Brassica napus TaxID=3708 RepID=A0ABQ8CKQ5_BRANA|nr:hypothetical protein HID58_025305 [Brassica napus]